MSKQLQQLEEAGYLDYCLSNGLIRSSKDITALDDGTFSVFHCIDGSYGVFSRRAMEQVFKGKRSIWDSDISFENGED